MSSKTRKTILIDLDGVLNEYEGNFDKDFIPLIKVGAKEFIEKLLDTFEIKLFTTRNKILAAKWLVENHLNYFISDITNIKEICWLYIDDRCLRFNGDYSELLNIIKDFRPWYRD